MNSSRMYGNKVERCGFGMHLDAQMKALDDMEMLLDQMKFTPKAGKRCQETKPFMAGIRS